MNRRTWAWVGAALVLSSAAGCSDEICIQWGENEGACPAQDQVAQYLPSDEFCDNEVESIDSEGEFVDGACCYDATTANPDELCGF